MLVVYTAMMVTCIMLLMSFLKYKQVARRAAKWETRYQSLFDHNPDGMCTIDKEGHLLTVNNAAETITGYTKEELVNTLFFLLIIPQEAERISRYFRKALQGDTQVFEVTCVCKDGKRRIIQFKLVPMLKEQEILGLYGILKDITEQKNAQKRLQESEERYKRLVKLSPEPIVVHRNGLIQFANPAFTELVGATSYHELIGKSVLHFSTPEFVKIVESRIQRLKKPGTFVPPSEEKVIRLDGTVIDVEVTGITLSYEDDTAVLMMVHDITKRKKAAEALRFREYQYRLLADYSQDMIRLVDKNGLILYASPSHLSNLGFTADECVGKSIFKGIHPDDEVVFKEQVERAIRQYENFTIEIRRIHKNGQWIWVESHGTLVLAEDGQLEHIVFTSRNIMERKQYEAKLEHLAFHDTLTGLPNRRSFTYSLEQFLQEAERTQNKLAVLFLDLDNFKWINDTLGHDVGDKLLKLFAERVRNCLSEHDILARLGGDEFTIILPNQQSEKGPSLTAERIISSLQDPWEIGEHTFRTTTSIGISLYPRDGEKPRKLMKCADMALYLAKEDGRNNYKFFI